MRHFVDHGIACIFDPISGDVAKRLADEDEGLDILADLWEYEDTPWFMWHEDVLAFRCGRGDGRYDTWVGCGRGDELASVVLDLELLPMPPDSE